MENVLTTLTRMLDKGMTVRFSKGEPGRIEINVTHTAMTEPYPTAFGSCYQISAKEIGQINDNRLLVDYLSKAEKLCEQVVKEKNK